MYLQLNNINKSFKSGNQLNKVIKNVSFELSKGDICILLGASGSGKSTLLNIIGAIETVDSGEIIIDGIRMDNLKEKELSKFRRKHLGYIFQSYNLIPNLTVRENIQVGEYLSDNPLDIEEVLDILGLKEHQNKLPNQLSGGQEQRTSIGRAIIKNPDILLCDEPTGALDSETSLEILKLIEKINSKYKTTILFVTHNNAMEKMGDKTIILRDGEIQSNIVNKDKLKASELIL